MISDGEPKGKRNCRISSETGEERNGSEKKRTLSRRVQTGYMISLTGAALKIRPVTRRMTMLALRRLGRSVSSTSM